MKSVHEKEKAHPAVAAAGQAMTGFGRTGIRPVHDYTTNDTKGRARLSDGQKRRVVQLIRRECCNLYEGSCLSCSTTASRSRARRCWPIRCCAGISAVRFCPSTRRLKRKSWVTTASGPVRCAAGLSGRSATAPNTARRAAARCEKSKRRHGSGKTGGNAWTFRAFKTQCLQGFAGTRARGSISFDLNPRKTGSKCPHRAVKKE